MMSKFSIVSISKDESFSLFESSSNLQFINNAVKNGKYDINIIKIPKNVTPLTIVYNDYIRSCKQLNDKKPDFIIFVHSDVNVNIEHMIYHIEQCESKYDVMGLCGCGKISVSQSPLNWFCGSRAYPNDRWGCVTHGELGNQTSYFSQHSPNILDHEVACIDGLCIIFTKKALESGLMFDETFKFDQYDTDISFQAIMKYNLKLGVIVEKSLQHFSVGRSILTEDFLKHELNFRKKWKLDIPKGSILEKIAQTI